MAGYSGTPLPKKLGIKPYARVAVLRAPDGFEATLGELPDGVRLRTRARGPLDVIVSFTDNARDLRRRFAALAGALDPAGGLWIAWPKRASGVATDLDENVVREVGLAAGLVDNKVCAIDETWSGLRFVIRLADRRPAVAGFSVSHRAVGVATRGPARFRPAGVASSPGSSAPLPEAAIADARPGHRRPATAGGGGASWPSPRRSSAPSRQRPRSG